MRVQKARVSKPTGTESFDTKSVILRSLVGLGLFGPLQTPTSRALKHEQLVRSSPTALLRLIGDNDALSRATVAKAIDALTREFRLERPPTATKADLLALIRHLFRKADLYGNPATTTSTSLPLFDAFALYKLDAPRKAAFALLYSGLLEATHPGKDGLYSKRDADAVLSGAAEELAAAAHACKARPVAGASLIANMQVGKLLRVKPPPTCQDALREAARIIIQKQEPKRAPILPSDVANISARHPLTTRKGVVYRLLVSGRGDEFVQGASTATDAETRLSVAVELTNADIKSKLTALCNARGPQWAFSVLAAYNARFLQHQAVKTSSPRAPCQLLVDTVMSLLENVTDSYLAVPETAGPLAPFVRVAAHLFLFPQPRDAPHVERQLQLSMAGESAPELSRRIQAALMALPPSDRQAFFAVRVSLLRVILKEAPANVLQNLRFDDISKYGDMIAALIFSFREPADKKRKADDGETAEPSSSEAPPAEAPPAEVVSSGPLGVPMPSRFRRYATNAVRLGVPLAVLWKTGPLLIASTKLLQSTQIGASFYAHFPELLRHFGNASTRGLGLNATLQTLRMVFGPRAMNEAELRDIEALFAHPADRDGFVACLQARAWFFDCCPPGHEQCRAVLARLRSAEDDGTQARFAVAAALLLHAAPVPLGAIATVGTGKLLMTVSYDAAAFAGTYVALIGSPGTRGTHSFRRRPPTEAVPMEVSADATEPGPLGEKPAKRPRLAQAEPGPLASASTQAVPMDVSAGPHPFGPGPPAAAPRSNFFLGGLFSSVRDGASRLASYPGRIFRFGARP